MNGNYWISRVEELLEESEKLKEENKKLREENDRINFLLYFAKF